MLVHFVAECSGFCFRVETLCPYEFGPDALHDVVMIAVVHGSSLVAEDGDSRLVPADDLIVASHGCESIGNVSII